MPFAERFGKILPYLWAEIVFKRDKLVAKAVDIISPTPNALQNVCKRRLRRWIVI